MKNTFTSLCFGLCVCLFAQAQNGVSSTKILSVNIRNNQIGSAKILFIDSLKNQPITLSYDQSYLLFNFINVQDSSQKSFSYILHGLDYEWITCQNCTQVQYAHLDGGEYTFEVKANQPNALPTQLNFKIEGNIWHQWWFIPVLFLYFLVIVGIGVYFFVLYQFRQKLKEQRLIHKEKMASMAEVTAGIAHEIQNPLNFVNNFAELSIELIEEVPTPPMGASEDWTPTDIPFGGWGAFFADLTQNLQKINHHGQRASNIVKGMLEHSRNTAGERQPTNLNTLAEENILHSYQGILFKNKDFKAV